MLQVTVEPHDIEGTYQWLNGIAQRLDRPDDLMNAIAILMRHSFAENFNQGGRPDKWPELAVRTLLEKMALFQVGAIRGRNKGVRVRIPPGQVRAGSMPGILIRYGRLKDAASRRGVQGNIHRLKDDGRTLEIGVGPIMVPELGRKIDYGVTHQLGDPSRRIPRRAFILIQDEDWNGILDLTKRYLRGEELRGGGKDQE